MTTYLATIGLNVNGSNAPIKRHRMAEWIRHTQTICKGMKWWIRALFLILLEFLTCKILTNTF